MEHIQQQSACSSMFLLLFLSYFLQLYLCTFALKVANFMIQEASPWPPFYIHAFIGSKFCPSLVDNTRLRIPCHNIIIYHFTINKIISFNFLLKQIFFTTYFRFMTTNLPSLTFKNCASYIWDGRTATLQMLHFIYFFSKYKYWVF